MNIPPLGRRLVTAENNCDNVWYGFFRGVYDLVKNTNTTVGSSNTTLAYNQANAAYTQANSARDQANTARTQANTAYGQANTAYGQANSAYGQANAAYSTANVANTTANLANAQANTARDQANTAYGQANSAYGQANTAYSQANAAFANSNSRQYGNITGGPGGYEDLAPILQAPNDVIARAPTWNETLIGYEFNQTNDRDWYMVYQLPHGWKRGSNIMPHIHVRPFANTNGNVWIMLGTTWSNSLGTQPAITYTNTNVVFSNGGGNIIMKEHIIGLGNTVPPADAKESSIVKYVMTRYSTLTEDNYNASMLLDSFDAHYYREKTGTDPEYPV